MSKPKKAAIDLDAIGSKTLAEISAADFLAALEQADVSIQRLVGLPEKKKYELWIEPEDQPPPPPTVGGVIDWVRTEKKKVELEVPPAFGAWKKIQEVRYNELVARVARDVEATLRQKP